MEAALIILVSLQFIVAYICIGLIIGQRKVSSYRIVAVLLLSVAVGLLYQIIGVYSALFLLLGNFYFTYIDLRRVIPTLGSLGIVMIFTLVFDHVASMIDNLLSIPSRFSPITYVLIHQGIVSIFSIVFIILTKKILDRNLSKGLGSKEGNVISLLCFFTYMVYLICIFLGVGLGNTIQLIQINLLFFVIYLLFMLFSFYFYSRSLKKEYQIKKQDAEHQALQRYTEEIETQYTQMRKFRHDYQNVLSSLSYYIKENDMVGLAEYYQTSLQQSSKVTVENNFKLGDLSKIELKPVKSLFASKLFYAQEQGLDASFEASDYITEIGIESLILVRVLGIFLDNSIEELRLLGYGRLRTAMIRYPNSVQIIVENTCRKEIEPYRKLRQPGYSTKGTQRGLGLSNVDELLANVVNVSLETRIENETFTQIIYIS